MYSVKLANMLCVHIQDHNYYAITLHYILKIKILIKTYLYQLYYRTHNIIFSILADSWQAVIYTGHPSPCLEIHLYTVDFYRTWTNIPQSPMSTEECSTDQDLTVSLTTITTIATDIDIKENFFL
jgi:hypothetical protein